MDDAIWWSGVGWGLVCFVSFYLVPHFLVTLRLLNMDQNDMFRNTVSTDAYEKQACRGKTGFLFLDKKRQYFSSIPEVVPMYGNFGLQKRADHCVKGSTGWAFI